MLRLVVVLMKVCEVPLRRRRVSDGEKKRRLLRAVDRSKGVFSRSPQPLVGSTTAPLSSAQLKLTRFSCGERWRVTTASSWWSSVFRSRLSRTGVGKGDRGRQAAHGRRDRLFHASCDSSNVLAPGGCMVSHGAAGEDGGKCTQVRSRVRDRTPRIAARISGPNTQVSPIHGGHFTVCSKLTPCLFRSRTRLRRWQSSATLARFW